MFSTIASSHTIFFNVTALNVQTVSCKYLYLDLCFHSKSVAMAVRSEAWVCSRLIAVIAGSSPVEGMDIRLLFLLCCVGKRLLRLGDLSFRGVLPPVCVCV